MLGVLQTIGRYEVVERLGSGGFATVYLVRDPVLDSEVAAKVLADNWSDKADLRDRFIREAQLLRRIDSDRVVTVHDIGELPTGQPYFVMALVDRGTLDERLVQMPSPSRSDALNVGRQLAECLRTIHAHDLIHRDIKPSNLLIAGPRSSVASATESGLLGPSERLVLGDFGLAKDVALQNTVGYTISAGTGGYAAPEQMSPVGVPDRPTDFYAATGVMYRVVSGETPPAFDLVSETVPFGDHEPWMAEPLGQFFRRGMAFAPQHRHASVEAWMHDLEAGLAQGETHSGRPTVAAPTPQPPGGKPATWAPPPNPSAPHPAVEPSGLDRSSFASNPTVSSGSNPLVPPSLGTPVVSSRANPVVPPPANPAPSSGYNPAVSSGPSFPVRDHRPPVRPGPVGGHHAPVGYRPPTASKSPKWWLLLVALAVAASGAGLFFVLRPAGPTVEGPDQIRAGENAEFTASHDGAAQFEWTDWNGDTIVTDQPFVVRAVAPGTLTFAVAAVTGGDGRSDSTSHTVTITESPNGPTIIGPSQVFQGQVQEYGYRAPEGATNPRWLDDRGTELAGEVYRINADTEEFRPGSFRVTLVVTLIDGTNIGTTAEIELLES